MQVVIRRVKSRRGSWVEQGGWSDRSELASGLPGVGLGADEMTALGRAWAWGMGMGPPLFKDPCKA
jgi:hypothetical protein